MYCYSNCLSHKYTQLKYCKHNYVDTLSYKIEKKHCGFFSRILLEP